MKASEQDAGRLYGYARVSTGKQESSLEHQQARLLDYGVQTEHDVFADHGVSGRTEWANRDGLARAIKTLRPGDTLVVTALDRLGRNAHDVMGLASHLREQGVHLVILDLGGDVGTVDTRTMSGKVLFQVLAVLAEMEHDIRSQRAVAGHQARKARGNNGGGRRETHSDAAIEKAVKRVNEGGERVADVARSMGIGRATLYRRAEKRGTPIG